MAEFLSERKLLFVRKKFDFPSKKNSFSFEQKIRGLKSVFSSIAVKFPMHCSAILDALFCPFFTRTYLSPFTYVCVSLRERSRRSIHTYVEGDRYYCLRELFLASVFALLKPKFLFLGFRRKKLAKIIRHKINLAIFKFHRYGDPRHLIYKNSLLWIY